MLRITPTNHQNGSDKSIEGYQLYRLTLILCQSPLYGVVRFVALIVKEDAYAYPEHPGLPMYVSYL